MAELKPTRQQQLINQYGPVTACLAAAQGVDPETLANERSVPGQHSIPTDGIKAYTAQRDQSAGPDMGQQVGVQVLDWHTNPLNGRRQTETEDVLADTAVSVMPVGMEKNLSLVGVPHTEVR